MNRFFSRLVPAVVVWALAVPTLCETTQTVSFTKGPGAVNQDNTTTDSARTDQDWKKDLTPEQYRILRQCGTEPPFTGKYWNSKDKGIYRCAACQAKLFTSDTKFDSGTGWPSFFDAVSDSIETKVDVSHGMKRTEIVCRNCGGHLGHVFEDGPPPTGLRYCVNSISLELEKSDKSEK